MPIPDSVAELVPDLREPVLHYVQRTRAVFADSVRSITLFGDSLDAAFDGAGQSLKSVLVLDRVRLDTLRRFSEHGPWLRRSSIRAPYVMTPDYIRATLDTFPLEFLEIIQRRRVVEGEDFFDAIVLDRAHVRLQCERELKTALIAMRQAVLASTGNQAMAEAFELEMGEGLLRTLRGLAWLSGHETAMPALDMVAMVETKVRGPLPGLRASLDILADHGWAEFDLLYRDIERLSEYVNAI